MANDIKYDVKLCIKQKINTIQMTGRLADNIVKSLEEMENYTVTFKQYDTPVGILSVAPALENMQIDKEVNAVFFSYYPCC